MLSPSQSMRHRRRSYWGNNDALWLGALVVIVATFCSAGCHTAGSFHGQGQIEEVRTGTPGVRAASSLQKRQKLESVLRLVLDAHNFVPAALVDGPDSTRWAISTRPASHNEAVLALVKIGSEGEVSVKLIAYAHIGSTWAVLGREFRGEIDQEKRQMDRQIRERLALDHP